MASMHRGFLQRARIDAAALAPYRVALLPDGHSVPALKQVMTIAHGLAGAGGIFGFPAISQKSETLEHAAEAMLDGTGTPTSVMRAFDNLLAQIATE